ncbi:MAG TPA: DUF87 domain-containing protein [Anaerolineaceae bacterium]|nr:DUF87 domain-containing protein [Anaerolineaceae bacterium]HPN52247.1 DUF87 domain-containing protein [Anaerolineaceae bacterium]
MPFFLGRQYDLAKAARLDAPLNYDPQNLTTHAFVTGMTGSGKTGLCVALLEEAALQKIPAIIIDLKGDLTNLMLHFPNLAPDDFLPWIDVDQARRENVDPAALAAKTAEKWRTGLADWGLGSDQLNALKDSAYFTIYTPGSDAGKSVSVLASLQAPSIPWEGNREILRERISSTVTALLGLIGFKDIDPVRSREHILLSNIFENAWSQGKSLDLAELIMQTQTPPFAKLGVFPIDSFFPAKDRFDLAMSLNNFLAAPSFQSWLEGQPLDIPSFLHAPDGKPCHSIFYLAHLGEEERMFFVTLLFSAIETWMRTQSGSTSLRALLYFDEVFGYLPPTANPPSKTILLRMLKQARAFGVGLLLATQNPVDIDYKALSNAGTWIIGKLQTDQDKQRLLDGLSSAGGGFDRSHYDNLISGLGKRVFLMHNVNTSGPQTFTTRWALNYLAGPLTRAQIPALNALWPAPAASTQPVSPAVPAAAPAANQPVQTQAAQAAVQPAVTASAAAAPKIPGMLTKPAVPAAVAEYYMPNNRTLAQSLQAESRSLPANAAPATFLYRPALLAQVCIRFTARKYNLDIEETHAALAQTLEKRGLVRWEELQIKPLDPRQISLNGLTQARFSSLEAPLDDAKALAALQKDYIDWAYRTCQLRIKANETLKVYAGPEVTTGEFREMCSKAARASRDAELVTINQTFDRKVAAIQDKLDRETRELQSDQREYDQRKMEEMGTHAENIFGFLTGSKRRVTSSLTKRRLTEESKQEVVESEQAIAAFKKQIDEIEKERAAEIKRASDRWADVVDNITEVPLTAQKKDIFAEAFGVIWLPFYVIQIGSDFIELPAYG